MNEMHTDEAAAEPGGVHGARPARLGEVLVAAGLIAPAQLEEALDVQRRTGERLGRVLMGLGFVRRRDMFRALATQQGIDLVTLNTVDADLIGLLPEQWMRDRQAIPYRMEGDALVLAMVDPLDAETAREAGRLTGRPIRRAVTTDLDWMWCLQKAFRKEHMRTSVQGLYHSASADCANVVITTNQFVILTASLIGLLAWIWLHWISAVIFLNAVMCLIYFLSTTFRFILSMQGVRKGFQLRVADEEVRALDDRDCPTFTILVPVYKEPAVIPMLVEGMKSLDYPKAKLDVKILFEENDKDTLQAAKAVAPPPYIHFVIVPDQLPKTKPKACNYGLLFARGTYLVIYDAEDVPEPDQLKKAVVAFRKSGNPNLVCIQAALNFFNTDYNLLTKWFTLEYAFWFNFFLPGLDRLNGIIPLGGTSNHFVTEKLRELNAWDPYNVTEDADLGVRLAARGFRTAVLNSTTYEEANAHVGNWLRQRSRWVKGYMQTYLVHMRSPLALARKIGWKNWWLFQFTVGCTFLLPLVNPVMWATFAWWLIYRPYILKTLFPWPILYMATLCFMFGNFLFAYFGLVPAIALRKPNLVRAALLLPGYWMLMSLAAYKGLRELVTNPFFWQKTTHGLVSHPSPVAAAGGGPASPVP
jgi:cellulose synthase/poly-beta-1,6-N-acetylglucosamine synthase-like glycosyltransferase